MKGLVRPSAGDEATQVLENRRSEGRGEGMKRILVLVAVLATAAIAATPAFASGTVTWTGQGSGNLPCSGGEHWVLSGNADVTGATLKFNGQVVATFSQSGGGSWSADTDLGITSADIGHVTA